MAGNVVISEFMADNKSTLADEDGVYSDWIELYNPGDASIDLAGWKLRDSGTTWTFPSRNLPAGQYLIVFASSKNRAGVAGNLHTNFNLSNDGEYLGLIRPDNSVAQEYNPYPSQRTDISFGTGQEILPGTLVSDGSLTRVKVPTNGNLANTWTGGNEPFDDSAAAGWTQGAAGVGFDSAPSANGNYETEGNPITSRTETDGVGGNVYVLESRPFLQDGVMFDWTIWGTAAGSITPLILQRDDFGDYVVTGIGQTRTVAANAGSQTFAFSLQSGGAQVGAEYYFGWKDGTAAGGNNAPVMRYTSNAGQSVRTLGAHSTVASMDDYGAGTSLSRTYSIQARSSLTGSPQPQGYWNFDDNVNDTSGNGHTGSLINGPTYSSTVPPALGTGKSLNFDGANDYVSVPIDVSETAYTSSMWFKTTNGNSGLFCVVDSDLGGGGHDRHIYLTGGNLGIRTWSNEVLTTSGKNYADNQWHHVAHVIGAAASGEKVYVDGQVVLTGPKASSDFNWQKHINIGFSNDAPGQYFSGQMDDVAVWDQVLSDAQILALAQGASPLSVIGFGPLVSTNVQSAMLNNNASAYIRMPFNVPAGTRFTGAVLRMKYDDGFIAYVNGVEVARRNAPASALFNSTAQGDRSKGLATRYEDIDLGTLASQLHVGSNVLAIQGLNSSASSPDFLIDPQLVLTLSTPNRYLSPATPGVANVAGTIDFVADTDFTVKRGYYNTPQSVMITSATPGATLIYTLDSSTPSLTNGIQVPPANANTAPTVTLNVNTTTNLRVIAVKSGWQSSNIDTQTYIFTASVAQQPALPAGYPSSWAGSAADYQVDPDVVNTTLPGYSFDDALRSLPTVSITTDKANMWDPSTGMYYNSENARGMAWERPASVEFFYPDGSTQGFNTNAGLRMHGNSSRSSGFTPKHPIRLEFRDQYGDGKLNYPLFPDSGVKEFDELLLRAASTDSWPVVDGGSRWTPTRATYMRDQWMRDTQNAMGDASSHGRYVQLFIDGLYWGLYNIAERDKDAWNAEYLGGTKDDYDVVKDFAELDAGTMDAWNAMISLASQGLASDANYYKIQGRNPDGTRNPNLPNYLDVDELINYMIFHIYAGAEDWPDHNWWGARKRGEDSEGFKFFSWDQEISNDSLTRTTTLFGTPFAQPSNNASPSYLYGKLKANPIFVRKFQDKVQEYMFNDGLLTPAQSAARWNKRQMEIDKAIVGESARWGDTQRANPFKRETDWLPLMDWTKNTYFPQIHNIALDRFKSVGLFPSTVAPSFSQFGGTVPTGYQLTMSAPAGQIWYTLDGSDPQTAGGAVAPGALLYSGPVTINSNTPVKARALSGGVFSALDYANFTVTGQSVLTNLRVTEIMYHPAPAITGVPSDSEFEYIEFQNVGTQPINLRGVRLTGDVVYTFDDVTLAAGQYGVIVANPSAFVSRYGSGINVLGYYFGRLDDGGAPLQVTLGSGNTIQTIQSFTYDDAWYDSTDGEGFSLIKQTPASADLSTWSLQSGWRTSGGSNGSPGTADITPTAQVVSRLLFYNNSKFDGFDPNRNSADDAAIATDKVALRPGNPKATFANYSSYSRGINGVMIDVLNLPGAVLSAANDFTFKVGNDSNPANWQTLAVAPTILVRPGAGANNSSRIELTWPDGTIRNQWLQVTLKATANTGITTADVFYFGSAPGDTGNDPNNAIVDTADYYGVRDHFRTYANPVPATYTWDFNHDSVVDAQDLQLVRASATTAATALQLITLPSPLATPPTKSPTPTSTSTSPTPTPTITPVRPIARPIALTPLTLFPPVVTATASVTPTATTSGSTSVGSSLLPTRKLASSLVAVRRW